MMKKYSFNTFLCCGHLWKNTDAINNPISGSIINIYFDYVTTAL